MTQYRSMPQVTPVFEAVEKATTDDDYLDVGKVMTENTVHELRCRFMGREPAEADRLATIEAIDELVATGWIKWDFMFGVRCVKRLV